MRAQVNKLQVDPVAQLKAGLLILDPLLSINGFVHDSISHGKGSGGSFATVNYNKTGRCLELHYRYGLGIAKYYVNNAELHHVSYMKLLGVYRKSAFASTELVGDLQGFEQLKQDLVNFGVDFLEGDGKEFERLAALFAQNPKMFSGFNSIEKY